VEDSAHGMEKKGSAGSAIGLDGAAGTLEEAQGR
jgi:hypothetical protein